MNEALGGLEAKIPQRLAPLGQRWIVSHHHAPFAGRDVLVGVETENTALSKGAARPAAVGLAVHLGRILEKREATPLGDLEHRVHIGRQAVNMDYQDCPGSWGDEALDLGHVHVPGDRIAVDQYWGRASSHHRGGRGNKSERGHDDLVDGTKTQRLDSYVQRCRT